MIIALKPSAPETVGASYVDLTLDKRFGYTRRIPFHICEERSEETVVGEKEHTGSLCWEEVDWHLRKREEQRDTSKDEGIIVFHCLVLRTNIRVFVSFPPNVRP